MSWLLLFCLWVIHIDYCYCRVYNFQFNITGKRFAYAIGDGFGLDSFGQIELNYYYQSRFLKLDTRSATSEALTELEMRYPGSFPYFVLLTKEQYENHEGMLTKSLDITTNDKRLLKYRPETVLCSIPTNFRHELIPRSSYLGKMENRFVVHQRGYYYLFLFHCNKMNMQISMNITGNASLINPSANPNEIHASIEMAKVYESYLTFSIIYIVISALMVLQYQIQKRQMMPAHYLWLFVMLAKIFEMLFHTVYYSYFHSLGIFMKDIYIVNHITSSISAAAFFGFQLVVSFGYSFQRLDSNVRDFVTFSSGSFFIIFSSLKNAQCKQFYILLNDKVSKICTQYDLGEHAIRVFSSVLILIGIFLMIKNIQRGLEKSRWNSLTGYQYQTLCAYKHFAIANIAYLILPQSNLIIDLFIGWENFWVLFIIRELELLFVYIYIWWILIRFHTSYFQDFDPLVDFFSQVENDEVDEHQDSDSDLVYSEPNNGIELPSKSIQASTVIFPEIENR